MISLRRSWLVALVCGAAMPLRAQDTLASDPAPSYTTLARANYRSLDAVRGGRIAMPSKLSRKITLTRHRVLLQQALLDIANQAGFGLSYGEGLVRAQLLVSIDVKAVRAADALASVVHGTGWMVFVNPAAQVTVVKAPNVRRGGLTGQVTDAKTGHGIAAAEVLLPATEWRTTTDTSGRYRLTAVDSGTYTLTVRRPGYTKQSRQVTVSLEGMDTVDLALTPVVATLNELIATATGQQRRRDLGNAITTIRADSVLQAAPIRNLTDLLDNRVPGLTVQHTSGAPGDPARLRLRGIGSVLRGNDPVVVVDGVRIYSAQSDARSGNLTNFSAATIKAKTCSDFSAPIAGSADGCLDRPLSPNVASPSPLDQIDPNIIEKIEVFKGPSAATLYGADAANGVIVITTKKGRPGPARWTANVFHGRTDMPGRWPVGYYRWGHIPEQGSSNQFCTVTNRACVQDSLVRFQALNEPNLTMFDQGRRTGGALTVSGGSQALTYSVTGSISDETGLLKLPDFEAERFRVNRNREVPDWMRRPHHMKNWNVSANITALLSPTLDMTLRMALQRTEQQRSTLENKIDKVTGTYVDQVNKFYYVPSGGIGSTVIPVPALLNDYFQRTTASTLTVGTGLHASWRPRPWLNANVDAGLNVIPREDETFLPTGIVTPTDGGAISLASGRTLLSTLNLQGGVTKRLGWGFNFETVIGANIASTSTADMVSAADGLQPGTSTLTGARSIWVTESRMNTSVFGWYIEPRITGQRISLSTGIRLDGGSAHSTRFSSLLSLPKFNGSWVISEEPFFPFKALFSSLRLRGAYGQAQVQPGPADRLRIYSPINEAGYKLTGVGNTNLRPERSVEFEGGIDADILDSRVSLEVTMYRKTQVDAHMNVMLPVSVNGGGSIIRNIGTIRNTGVEVVLGVTPVQTQVLNWSARLMYSHNTNTLVKLGESVVPNKVDGLVEGYPVRGRWARPILGYVDANANQLIERQEIRLGDSLVYMGRLLPDYTTAFSSNLALFGGRIGIFADFSYDAGATQIDETAKTNWVLSRALFDPTAPANEQAAVLAMDSTEYGLTQDVSTFRFKSFTVSYRVPDRLARLLRAQQLNISVQGSNLGLHSTYRGKDPDVNAWSTSETIRDRGQLPLPRTWQLAMFFQY